MGYSHFFPSVCAFSYKFFHFPLITYAFLEESLPVARYWFTGLKFFKACHKQTLLLSLDITGSTGSLYKRRGNGCLTSFHHGKILYGWVLLFSYDFSLLCVTWICFFMQQFNEIKQNNFPKSLSEHLFSLSIWSQTIMFTLMASVLTCWNISQKFIGVSGINFPLELGTYNCLPNVSAWDFLKGISSTTNCQAELIISSPTSHSTPSFLQVWSLSIILKSSFC